MSQPRSTSGGAPHDAPLTFRLRAVAALDLVFVALVLLGSSISVFGAVRFFLGTVRVSATSATEVWALVAAVVIARQLLQRRPSLLDRAGQTFASARRFATSDVTLTIVPIWAAARLGVLLVALAALATIGPVPESRELRVTHTVVGDLPFRWDTGWYLAIAVDGYRWDPGAPPEKGQNIAFLPAYPILMRIGGALIGARTDSAPRTSADRYARLRGRTLLAGWLLSLTASCAALFALFAWASSQVNKRTAVGAVALLSAYPFAVYFSAAYTEPLFLLGAVSAFNACRSQRAGPAAAWGMFTGLVRPNGFLITLPLMLLAAQQRATTRVWLAATMPCVGMLLFSGYIWTLTGRPFAWMAAHAAWGRTVTTWETGVLLPLQQIVRDGALAHALSAPYQALNAVAVLFALALVPLVWRRLGAAPALFTVLMIGPPLLMGGLISMGRVTSTVFPIFVALATVIPRRHTPAWLTLFALGEGLAAVLFFTWRPLV